MRCFFGWHYWVALGTKLEPFPGKVVVRMECCARCPAVRYRKVPNVNPGILHARQKAVWDEVIGNRGDK